MPKIDPDSIPSSNATGYPTPWAAEMAGRHYRRLAPAAGISDFGVSHVMLDPGGVSSQRHWHEGEDEMVIMLAGEAELVEDGGRTPMRTGDIAVFPKGVANGHRLENVSAAPCLFVAVGKAADTDCHYPDIDLHLDATAGRYRRKDGRFYETS